MSTLVILESPGKINKMQHYLGDGYIVKASIGHIMDLPSDGLNIDIQNNFEPKYEISKDKKQVVKDLQKCASKCDHVLLAADEDREGEFIAYSVAHVLNLKNAKRIVFNEITKKALDHAVKNPRNIDMNMVQAQQTRRLLDRLVGYQISPIVSNKLSGKLSAGRVQSVAVRLINDKEKEITNSLSTPYFKLNADFNFNETLIKSLLYENNKVAHFNDKTIGRNIIDCVNKSTIFIVTNVENKTNERYPSPPFTTSSLQQEGSLKLRLKVEDTMKIAQKLYESGYITYMRTDSTTLSNDCTNMCEKYIKKTFGDEYHKYRQYTTKSKNAQEAHEAIRPTKIDCLTTEKLDEKHEKLYKLIWNRTVASQMANAKIENQTISIDGQNKKKSILLNNFFVSSFQKILFPGFLSVYNNIEDEEELDKTISITIGQILNFNNMICSQEYTKPPLRYNEALFVKQLEKLGIGRPSTFANIISKIKERKYVEIKNIDGVEQESLVISIDNKYKINEKTKKIKIGSEKNKMCPTILGIQVVEFLETNFDEIMDYKFTAKMEEYLDKIANGKKIWHKVLASFQETIQPKLDLMKTKNTNETMDELLGNHPDGGQIFKGSGKFGPYLVLIEGTNKKYVSIKDKPDISLKEGIDLLIYPKNLGKIDGCSVLLKMGQYGPYCTMDKKNIQIKDVHIDKITLDTVKKILSQNNETQNTNNKMTTIKIKSKMINIKEGPYGLYFEWKEGQQNMRKTFPKNWDVNKLDLSKVEFYLCGKQK
jgi:DNA topoisomerase-1